MTANSPLRSLLAISVLVVTALLDTLIIVCGVPPGADNIITGTILGGWNAYTSTVINYLYGHSSDSDRKTELLAKSVPLSEPAPQQTGSSP